MNLAKEKIKNIADELDIGMKVFININTTDLVCFPDEDEMDRETKKLWKEDMDKVKKNRKAYIEIEKPSSRESYEIMQDFIFTIKNKSIANRLTQAITGRKPFANFKFQIDQLGPEREKWFEFKEMQLISYVKNQLEAERG